MRKTETAIKWGLGVALFTLLVGYLNLLAYQRIKADILQDWELFAQNIVNGLNPVSIGGLQASSEDLGSADYLYIQDQLHKMMTVGVIKNVRWLYLMKVVNGDQVKFTIDSVPENDSNHAVPGEDYLDYPQAILDAQATKKRQLVENYVDEWGNFLSVFVPVMDSNNEVVGVLGLDVDGSAYLADIRQKMMWPLLVTVIVAGLLMLLAIELNSQKTLRENAALFHALSEGVLDAIVAVDGSGHIALWNKAAEKMFGWSDEAAIGQQLFELIASKDADKAIWEELKHFSQVNHGMLTGKVVELEVKRKNKDLFNVQISASTVQLWGTWHVIGIVHDITMKVQENKELLSKSLEIEDQRKAILNVLEDVNEEKDKVKKHAEELKKFEAAVHLSNEMMVFVDSEGIVLWGNPAVKKVTGFTAAEARGKKAGVLWGNLMNDEWYAHLWHRIKVEKKIFIDTITNHRKSGEKFVSLLTIYPLLDDQGDVKIFVATQRDVTREKEIDRMKTDFISLASHQLRTPLSAMKWFLEMLLAGDMGKLSKEQKEAVTNVETSNERMISLVNGLLNISRIESGRIIIEPEPTNIATLAKSIITELTPKFKQKQQTILISASSRLPEINLDPRLIRQVFMNLLTNANKYTPKKGEITIFISKKNDEVVVQVSDDGYGIPEDEQNKIFMRFFRASNAVKQETDGNGLGLFLVKAVVESSGGKIWFKSKIDSGTSFWFTLPVKGVKAKKGEVRLS